MVHLASLQLCRAFYVTLLLEHIIFTVLLPSNRVATLYT